MARLTWMAVVAACVWIATAVGVSTSPQLSTAVPRSARRTGGFTVTPVSGPSNLHRLRLTVQRTAMGSAGRWGPSPPPTLHDLGAVETYGLAQPAIVAGADLYRLNCRPCHRADGTGAPPEIGSLIDPVRSISPHVMRQRMQVRGTPISAAFAQELTSESRRDVLTRLRSGGKKMPAFDHLDGVEVEALLAYLELIAGVPGAEQRQIRLSEPAHRVGEHLIKGTCHICHDATGRWPDAAGLLAGDVPPLAELLRRHTVFDVTQKVRYGMPVIMGQPAYQYRGRMPVFNYLTEDEVRMAYMYLIAYPPR